jgi:hypothetical protein
MPKPCSALPKAATNAAGPAAIPPLRRRPISYASYIKDSSPIRFVTTADGVDPTLRIYGAFSHGMLAVNVDIINPGCSPSPRPDIHQSGGR